MHFKISLAKKSGFMENSTGIGGPMRIDLEDFVDGEVVETSKSRVERRKNFLALKIKKNQFSELEFFGP